MAQNLHASMKYYWMVQNNDNKIRIQQVLGIIIILSIVREMLQAYFQIFRWQKARKLCCNPILVRYYGHTRYSHHIFWNCFDWNLSIFSNQAFHTNHMPVCWSSTQCVLTFVFSLPLLNCLHVHPFLTVGYATYAFLYTACTCVWICNGSEPSAEKERQQADYMWTIYLFANAIFTYYL